MGIGAELGNYIWRFFDGEMDELRIYNRALSEEEIQALYAEYNHPPVLDPVGNQTVNENDLLEFTVTATDEDPENTLTFSAASLPEGSSFDPVTAIFSWTPNYDQAGNYEDVQFCVADDGDPLEVDCETTTITVGNVNRIPVIDLISPIDAQEYDLVEFTVTATDPDYDNISLSTGYKPAGAIFDPTSGLFTWIPNYEQAGIHVVEFMPLMMVLQAYKPN